MNASKIVEEVLSVDEWQAFFTDQFVDEPEALAYCRGAFRSCGRITMSEAQKIIDEAHEILLKKMDMSPHKK